MGLKLNMTARFDKWEHRVPVTLIKADPNVILSQKDGKVELGFGRRKKVKKTQNAHVSVAGFAPRFIKEVTTGESNFASGDKVTVSVFEPGDLVKVTGITKGKGFAGGVKRWGFAGGPKTHGQSDRHRAPGSIGQTTTPGRVFKGKKMAGHLGTSKKTINNLEVLEVDSENNLLVIKGSVPGARMGLLLITKTGKAKAVPAGPPREASRQGYTLPPSQKEDEKQDRQTTKKETSKQDENQQVTTKENRKGDRKSEEKEKENATENQ